MAEPIPLFVGGPWHGRRYATARHGDLPHTWMVAAPLPEPSFYSSESPVFEMPMPIAYHLRWYTEAGPDGPQRSPAYVNAGAERYGQGGPGVTGYDLAVADYLLDQMEHAALPVCVAPGCDDKAPVVFVAAESGRLAGRDWRRGDEIRMCPKHGYDVRVAAASRGMDQLPEWLRRDAMWDPLDTYDGGQDLLYGAQILERTARMLRLGIRAEAARG